MSERRDDPKRSGGLALKERVETKKPPMYKVLIHNDDFTTMEFVIHILKTIFHLPETEATRITLHVHQNGVGVAGVYTREIAETRCQKVIAMAQRMEFPLQCTSEEA